MRPRGMPPMPSARSSDSAPVGMASTLTCAPSSPMRMTEPLPNWRSIWVSAPCRAASRALPALLGVLVACCSSGCSSEVSSQGRTAHDAAAPDGTTGVSAPVTEPDANVKTARRCAPNTLRQRDATAELRGATARDRAAREAGAAAAARPCVPAGGRGGRRAARSAARRDADVTRPRAAGAAADPQPQRARAAPHAADPHAGDRARRRTTTRPPRRRNVPPRSPAPR